MFYNKLFFRELYLDGNELRCIGVFNLLKNISDECEKNAVLQDFQDTQLLQEELKKMTERIVSFK